MRVQFLSKNSTDIIDNFNIYFSLMFTVTNMVGAQQNLNCWFIQQSSLKHSILHLNKLNYGSHRFQRVKNSYLVHLFIRSFFTVPRHHPTIVHFSWSTSLHTHIVRNRTKPPVERKRTFRHRSILNRAPQLFWKIDEIRELTGMNE